MLFFRKHVRGWQWLIVTPYRMGSALKTTIRLLRYRRVTAVTGYWWGLLAGIASLRK